MNKYNMKLKHDLHMWVFNITSALLYIMELMEILICQNNNGNEPINVKTIEKRAIATDWLPMDESNIF